MVIEKDGWIETLTTFDYFLAYLIILYLAHFESWKGPFLSIRRFLREIF